MSEAGGGRAREQMRKSRLLHNLARSLRSRMPKRFFYSPKYFEILKLNRKYQREGLSEEVKGILDKQLAHYLREALRFVPYYRETIKIDPAGIDQSNAVDALMEFPFLHKKTVMENRDAFINEKYSKDDMVYYTSGGSTAQGIGVWRTKEEIEIEFAFVISEWGRLGLDWERSRIVRISYDAEKKMDESPFIDDFNRLYISTFHLNDRWMEEIYGRIVDYRPDFIWTYPSGLEQVAKHMLLTGKPKMRLKGILTSSEMLYEQQYSLFKKTFDCPMSDLYGLTERTNQAFSREYDDRPDFYYRLVDTYGYSENFVDESGNYELVGTSYWNVAMPLIRYRTRDMAKIEDDGTITRILGRTREMLVDKSGGKIPGLSVSIGQFTWDYVDIHQFVQEKPGELIIKIVPRSNYDQSISDRILNQFGDMYSDFFDFRIELVDSLPRTKAGKHMFIVCNIKDE